MQTEPLPAPVEAPPHPDETLHRALDHLARVQWDRGCWAGEVKWCTMLLAQYVIVSYATGQPIDPERRRKFIQYFEVWEVEGGGWGMHWESPAYVYMTVLGYIALRMMGMGPDEPLCRRAREWLRKQGGIREIPSWGKFWLAMMHLYDWDAVNPIQPELWLLPEWAPVHPRRMYNHTRLIYLGIGYLYGRRFTIPYTPLVDELRRELYDQPYETIDFAKYRHSVAKSDLYVPPSALLKAGYDLLHAYESVHSKALRKRALDVCFERIVFEVRSTRYACVSPVNGLLNVLALWDRQHPDFLAAYRGVDYWAWEDEKEGIRFNGAHSHTWDTAFTVQAILDGPEDDVARMAAPLRAAYEYFREAQMKTEIDDRERWYRDRRFGGFCFSDEHHQWPVSDCTAESLSALLGMEARVAPGERISDEMLVAAAEFVLSRQNDDGGWGSYERNRGSLLLELVNPSEMFGNCMVELSYVECTASCVAALARFRRRFPDVQRDAVDEAVARGVKLLLRAQWSDGSWEGFWGVNFTYAIMYVVEGLVAAGLPPSHPAIARSVKWLLAHQKPDGGWGEHYASHRERRYVEHPQSQVIMTSWAMMALAHVAATDDAAFAAMQRGAKVLASRQFPDGDFPEEGVGGVFFNTAMHHYCLYKNHFAVWALGRFAKLRRQREARR